jgi:4-amino-4-deoxy-L-arabinose transferase-like glycosyltransferase
MKKYILLGIVLLAAFLRFVYLGSIPPSLTWDEAAWGYNAYAIGIDGKDEFGRSLPVDFIESFGDYKPPVYMYLDVLPVKLLGLTEFAVRFPSALFGTLAVFMTYFVVKAIFFARTKQKHESDVIESVALLSAFLLAISPWHILLSRGAFEANVASFFILFGIWAFLEAVNRRKWFLILSAISFVLAVYTFNSARIVGPIIVLGLSAILWKQLWKMKTTVATAGVIGFIILLPTLTFLFSPQAKLRFQEVNIFSNIKIVETLNEEVANDNNAWWSKIIHNRRLAYSVEYLNHYFDNLSPDFLFIHGDRNPKFTLQTMGQLYLFELPFLIIGTLYLFRRRQGHWWVIPFWLLAGIIPAGFARETPHALRIESSLPTFQILIAYGIVQTYVILKKSFWKKFFVVILSIAMLCQFAYAVEEYTVHYSKVTSSEWQYGYKDAITYINSVEGDYEQYYFTEQLGRPYIYFLLHKKYDPEKFRKEATVDRDVFGFVNVQKFNKYVFDRKVLVGTKKTLYVEVPKYVPKGAKVVKKFYYLNGKVSLVAYTL